MTGQHIANLRRATSSSASEKLQDSADAWLGDAVILENMAQILSTTAAKVKKGFSDGKQGAADGTAETGSAVFLRVSSEVADRGQQMRDASVALRTSGRALKSAELMELPDPPAPLPERPSTYGTEDDIDAIRAQRSYDATVTRHNADASAFADADEKARVKLQKLDEAYVEASAVLARIHGEPVYPEDLPPGGGPGPGGFPVGPSGGGPRPPGGIPVHPPSTTGHPPPIDIDHGPGPGPGPGGNPDIDHPGPGPVGGTLGNPGGPHTSGVPGINPILGGGIAAGVFGGPGLVNAVRGALGGRGGFGSTNGTIGSTTRTGGSGTLGGRSGGAVPGSQAGRGGGRAGGAGGGRGAGGRGGAAPGTAGGRGGGRGAAAAGAGGRGRKGRDEEGRERDLFDDGSDWIDDEGAGPDVLG